MRTGSVISGGMHAGLLILVVWGTDWFAGTEPAPLTVTEIELVDGTEFEAALSTAPVVQNEGPSELSAPNEDQTAPGEVPQPEDEPRKPDVPELANSETTDEQPDKPLIQIPPPPTNVPTEPPVASIAEIPSPDPLDRQSTEPESPASTAPVQPLASAPAPQPAPRPTPPPEPEPEIVKKPDPEPVKPQVADVAATEAAKPEPEPIEKPEPESVVEAQPEAPEGLAPREARLPVAKPADLAAAAQAASKPEEAQQVAAAKPDTPKPAQAAKPSGSTAVRAPRLNRGEKDALRIGVKKYYTYNGDRSDRSLQVAIRIKLDKTGKIVGKPEQRKAAGGNSASQRAVFQAGRRALIRAANAGEFKKLPVDKYERWKVINFIFTTEKIGVSS